MSGPSRHACRHLTRVKTRLSIHAHRKVRGLLEGEYAAIQVGRGIDFNDLREYVRGDDVKDIDWKASARSRMLLVRRYVAERKHTVVLAVSTGRSMAAMNDAQQSKRDLAVFVTGVMGYLAVRHGDLVALVTATPGASTCARPTTASSTSSGCSAWCTTRSRPTAPASDLTAVLDYVARAIRRRTILVVVSDETTISEELAESLRRLTAQHEVLFLTIGDLDPTIGRRRDPRERRRRTPPPGRRRRRRGGPALAARRRPAPGGVRRPRRR